MATSIFMIYHNIVYAASDLPWESPLAKVAASASGPVAKTIGVIALVCTGLSLAANVPRGMVKRVLQVIFGLSIAFTAASFFLGFFGYHE